MTVLEDMFSAQKLKLFLPQGDELWPEGCMGVRDWDFSLFFQRGSR